MRKCYFPLFDTLHVDLLSAEWRFLDILLLSDSDVPLQRTPRLFLFLTQASSSSLCMYICECVCVCVYVCVVCVVCSHYICICFDVVVHACIFKFMHFGAGTHTYWSMCQCVCVCVCVHARTCVSCWWYFPRAPCYAGQLLHPSCFDSSAVPPRGALPHTETCACVCACTCMGMLV